MHEHLCCTSPGIWQVWPELLGGRERVIERCTEILKQARDEADVRSFVDLTTFDLGRDIRLIQEVARGSGVHIIVCTGHHMDPNRTVAARDVDELVEWFVREIESGIEGTDVRAGIIKVANDVEGVPEQGERFLRAAARAHRRTRVPISTHSYAPGEVGTQQVRTFEQEGVDLHRVCIGHSNDSTDLDYLTGLLDRGCWLGMDRFPGGRTFGPNWETRCLTIKELIDRGYADKLLISHDWPFLRTGHPRSEVDEYYAEYNPDGILFIHRKVLPYLRDLGLDSSVLQRLLVDNPRRFFEAG
jgi:phosphotriesterase-related protein